MRLAFWVTGIWGRLGCAQILIDQSALGEMVTSLSRDRFLVPNLDWIGLGAKVSDSNWSGYESNP